MKILISNLKGKDLLDIAMKNQIDKLISLYSNYNETSLLDQYMTKENIKIVTTNPIDACKQLTDILKSSKDEGEVYVATDGNFIGSLLNFVANKEGADFIYYCFDNQIIQMPRLSINLSKTKNEPKWMLDFRLKSFEAFLKIENPNRTEKSKRLT